MVQERFEEWLRNVDGRGCMEAGFSRGGEGGVLLGCCAHVGVAVWAGVCPWQRKSLACPCVAE
jgi:hypothetical protein